MQGANLVVHYGEIGTKGNNRPVFEKSLERSLSQALYGLDVASIKKVNQRFLIEVKGSALDEAMVRLRSALGVVWFAPVSVAPLSYGEIRDTSRARLREANGDGRTFRIVSRRANKAFPMSSQELAIRLGADLKKSEKLEVNLSKPDTTIYVDVLSDVALVYTRKLRGPGGLPVGVSGRVIHLLSGGIDSPVAAWLMMKRGCVPIYLHFYVAPDPALLLETKIIKLVKNLSKYSGKTLLILLPFAPYQLASADISYDYEPTLFRRFMRLVAERMAHRFEALGVSTGDNLAQVASQTLQNIVCIDFGCELPVLRPLLSYDKSEIVDLSKALGTYETSIEQYKDCCSIISRHPKTRLKPDTIELLSRRLRFDSLAERTISLASIFAFDPRDGTQTLRPLQENARLVEN